MARVAQGLSGGIRKIVVTYLAGKFVHSWWNALAILAVVSSCSALPRAQQLADFADPQIKSALRDVSAGQIQSDIEKLASFQTRSTLSAQETEAIKAGRGIGAAREWIKSEFERYSHDCGGCLEVKTDAFTQPVSERVSSPTVITNVYAILRGTNPEDAKRVVLVTGHYDSRNSNNDDKTGIAPGANDDASGTAVSLECARVLSKLRFPGTIIFFDGCGRRARPLRKQALCGLRKVTGLGY